MGWKMCPVSAFCGISATADPAGALLVCQEIVRAVPWTMLPPSAEVITLIDEEKLVTSEVVVICVVRAVGTGAARCCDAVIAGRCTFACKCVTCACQTEMSCC